MKAIRRKRKLASRLSIHVSGRRARKKEKALLQHKADIHADQSYGITLGDGSIASIENGWVRKAFHRQGKLYRKDRPKAA